jgi:hypothetical protein
MNERVLTEKYVNYSHDSPGGFTKSQSSEIEIQMNPDRPMTDPHKKRSQEEIGAR